MGFDLASAAPAGGGFDLASAAAVGSDDTTPLAPINVVADWQKQLKYPNGPKFSMSTADMKAATDEDREFERVRQHYEDRASAPSDLKEDATRFTEGVRQLGAHMLDVGGSGKWTGPITNSVTSEINSRRADYNAQRGLTPSDEAVVNATSSAPLMAIPGGSTGYLANIAKQGATGAFQGLMTFNKKGENASQGAIGAILGSGLATVAGAVPTAFNYVKSKINTLMNEGRAGSAVAAIQEVLPNTHMDLGQLTGNPTLVRMARSIGSSSQLTRYADQGDAFIGDAASALKQEDIMGGGWLHGQLTHSQGLYQSSIDSAVLNRSNMWQVAVARFEEKAAPLGNVPTPKLFETAESLLSQEQNKIANPGGFNIGAGVKTALQDIKTYLTPKPVLTDVQRALESANLPAEVKAQWYKAAGVEPPAVGSTPHLALASSNEALTGIRKIMESDDPQTRVLGGQLYGALMDDLKTGVGNHPVLQDLQDLRSEYGRQSTAIQAMRDSGTAKMLGAGQNIEHASQLPTGEDIWTNFKGLTPGRQADAVEWITKNNPAALPQMRQQLVNEAVAASTAKTPVGVLAGRTNLPDADKAFQEIAQYSSIWNPQQRKIIQTIRDASGALQATNTGKLLGGQANNPMNELSNTAYLGAGALRGSIALGTKFLMKVSGNSQLFENALLNPNVQWAAKKAATSGPGQKMARAVLLTLLDHNATQGDDNASSRPAQ